MRRKTERWVLGTTALFRVVFALCGVRMMREKCDARMAVSHPNITPTQDRLLEIEGHAGHYMDQGLGGWLACVGVGVLDRRLRCILNYSGNTLSRTACWNTPEVDQFASGPFQETERDIEEEYGAIVGPWLAHPHQTRGSGSVDTKRRSSSRRHAAPLLYSTSHSPPMRE